MVKKVEAKSKIVKYLLRTMIVLASFFFLIVVGLFIYSSQSYEALQEMRDEIEYLPLSEVTFSEDHNTINYTISDPLANIIFVPGGLVEPDSYQFLAARLAMEGYNVTIVKVAFNLAILTPNKASRYIVDDLDNIIIGHSLGGVVASMVAAKQEGISKIIMLGSYPIADISSIDSLMITAEHDDGMDPIKFNDSLIYVSETNNTILDIEGGNHAQFGWYGPQKGDGEAEISTLLQQEIVIQQILDFLED